MDSNHPSPNLASGSSGDRATGAHYIDPAELVPVMQEQFDYLLAHINSACPPSCPACRRLKQIKGCLLQPFAC